MNATVDPGREEGAGQESVPARHLSLIGAAAKLRSRRRRPFPIETVLLVAGGLLLPIGIIVIIVGWYGSAHTFHTYEQNDYLISGGLLGLGLVFIGGFLYFGYWMTRQIRTSTTANQQMLQALGRIEAQLGAGANGKHTVAPLGVSAAAIAPPRGRSARARSKVADETTEKDAAPRPAGRGAEPAAAAATTTIPLVATERGNLIHRPDCPVVANKDNLRAVGPHEPGFRPCQICSPFDDR
ncbi:MAG TPA: hypothetical protein VNF71_06920 [Acidimicrobiales bacterium]|nr:hypothetical protein [Acidimicrobiales bacterium]